MSDFLEPMGYDETFHDVEERLRRKIKFKGKLRHHYNQDQHVRDKHEHDFESAMIESFARNYDKTGHWDGGK